jgi:flagellar motor switch protein FliG
MKDFEEWFDFVFEDIIKLNFMSEAINSLIRSVAKNAWQAGYQKAKEDIYLKDKR